MIYVKNYGAITKGDLTPTQLDIANLITMGLARSVFDHMMSDAVLKSGCTTYSTAKAITERRYGKVDDPVLFGYVCKEVSKKFSFLKTSKNIFIKVSMKKEQTSSNRKVNVYTIADKAQALIGWHSNEGTKKEFVREPCIRHDQKAVPVKLLEVAKSQQPKQEKVKVKVVEKEPTLSLDYAELTIDSQIEFFIHSLETLSKTISVLKSPQKSDQFKRNCIRKMKGRLKEV